MTKTIVECLIYENKTMIGNVESYAHSTVYRAMSSAMQQWSKYICTRFN